MSINESSFVKAEDAFEDFMKAMGLNMEDPSLQKTPYRVTKMFFYETCKGLFEEHPKVTTFPNDGEYTGMVLVKDIEIKSLCEHHFQPFIGKCHIAYIPDKEIIGLSKFSRIADWRARRPQVQERLTTQIFEDLKSILKTDNVAVYIDSVHYCMKIRGVQEHNASTVTAKLGGEFFDDPKTRQEFYNAISKDA